MYIKNNKQYRRRIHTAQVVVFLLALVVTVAFVFTQNKIKSLLEFNTAVQEIEINVYEFAYAYKATLVNEDKKILSKLNDSKKDLIDLLENDRLHSNIFFKQYKREMKDLEKLVQKLYLIFDKKSTLNFRDLIKEVDFIIDERLNKQIDAELLFYQRIEIFLFITSILFILLFLYAFYLVSKYFDTLSINLENDLHQVSSLITKIKHEEKNINITAISDEFSKISYELLHMKEDLDKVTFSKEERDNLLNSIGKYRCILHFDGSVTHLSKELMSFISKEKDLNKITIDNFENVLSYDNFKKLIEKSLLSNQQFNFSATSNFPSLTINGVILSNSSIFLIANKYLNDSNTTFLPHDKMAFFILNEDGLVLRVNYLFELLFRLERKYLENQYITDICASAYCNKPLNLENIKNLVLTEKSMEMIINPSYQEDKRYSKVSAFDIGVDKDSRPLYMVTFKDITELRLSEEKIYQLAYHDSLTGLANRTYLIKYLDSQIAKAKRNKTNFLVFFLDLDDFKIINDTLGHDKGDEVLQLVAQRLKKSLREEDFIARLGGDEFCVVTEDTNVNSIAKKIIKNLNMKNRLNISINVSIGISIYPNDATDSISLLKTADTAMYEAKNSNKNTFKMYNKSISQKLEFEYELIKDIQNALVNQEFELYYQPQVLSESQKVFGVEALIRWIHPIRGIIYPLDFILLAEKYGLINDITKWVVQESCTQQVLWKEQGINLKTSINITADFFQNTSFIKTIKDILKTTNITPSDIKLEITESKQGNIEKLLDKNNELKSLGFEIAIDDFGTGYSSLSVLQKLNVDILKIDKSFIDNCVTDYEMQVLIEAIIKIANVMNIKVIVEGVETQEQIDYLSRYKGIIFQGYYFSRPLPRNDLEKYIVERKCVENV